VTSFRCAPSSARKRTLNYFLSLYGSLGVIGIISLLGSTPRPVAVSGSVAICLFLLWGSRRAARVSIIASEDRVTVSNQFRTRVLPWSEIDRIELSQLPGYLGSYVPALAFRLKSGSRVKAQAVSSSRSDQEAMLTDWSRVAPSGVTVDTDVDSHRPQPFRFKRS
jgi:hypothetical protein